MAASQAIELSRQEGSTKSKVYMNTAFVVIILLSKSPGLALTLQKREDVAFPDWPLHVTHNETVLVVEELDTNLGDLATRPGPTHDFDYDSELKRRLLRAGSKKKRRAGELGVRCLARKKAGRWCGGSAETERGGEERRIPSLAPQTLGR